MGIVAIVSLWSICHKNIPQRFEASLCTLLTVIEALQQQAHIVSLWNFAAKLYFHINCGIYICLCEGKGEGNAGSIQAVNQRESQHHSNTDPVYYWDICAPVHFRMHLHSSMCIEACFMLKQWTIGPSFAFEYPYSFGSFCFANFGSFY